jgi:hypothetical protein
MRRFAGFQGLTVTELEGDAKGEAHVYQVRSGEREVGRNECSELLGSRA